MYAWTLEHMVDSLLTFENPKDREGLLVRQFILGIMDKGISDSLRKFNEKTLEGALAIANSIEHYVQGRLKFLLLLCSC